MTNDTIISDFSAVSERVIQIIESLKDYHFIADGDYLFRVTGFSVSEDFDPTLELSSVSPDLVEVTHIALPSPELEDAIPALIKQGYIPAVFVTKVEEDKCQDKSESVGDMDELMASVLSALKG